MSTLAGQDRTGKGWNREGQVQPREPRKLSVVQRKKAVPKPEVANWSNGNLGILEPWKAAGAGVGSKQARYGRYLPVRPAAGRDGMLEFML